MSSGIERWLPPNDPKAFESLCLDLWREIWLDSNAQKNGRTGQSQAGVDVFGQDEKGWAGVQCKQKDGLLWSEVTNAELEKEIEAAKKFQPKLASFVLATTGPRDAKVQKRARELDDEHKRQDLFSVSVWAWEDIWHELSARSELLKRVAKMYWPLSNQQADINVVNSPGAIVTNNQIGNNTVYNVSPSFSRKLTDSQKQEVITTLKAMRVSKVSIRFEHTAETKEFVESLRSFLIRSGFSVVVNGVMMSEIQRGEFGIRIHPSDPTFAMLTIGSLM
jgi:hypothetical protein